jgi:hypothetical protein
VISEKADIDMFKSKRKDEADYQFAVRMNLLPSFSSPQATLYHRVLQRLSDKPDDGTNPLVVDIIYK